jgi:hypothetical protein
LPACPCNVTAFRGAEYAGGKNDNIS